jgi:hypothetical protein
MKALAARSQMAPAPAKKRAAKVALAADGA